jgi:hypothetical protein
VQQVNLTDEGLGDGTRTLAVEVLVVGPDDWAVNDASSQLLAAGRKVHRCCDSADAPFPCNALIPGRGCPLDQHQIDVVLDISSRGDTRPSISEMGAVCGLRGGIPLVIAGISDLTSFAPWARPVPHEGDIIATCDEAMGSVAPWPHERTA